MRTSKLLLPLLLVLPALGSLAQEIRWSPEQVFYGPGGALLHAPDTLGNVIPDFSHVGYRYGDDSIPDVAVVLEIDPVEGDDGAHIQAAIDQVSAMEPDADGFRGALLLRRGTYEVAGQLKIGASGVVLRGEGQGEDGTVITATGTSKRDLILVDNGASLTLDAGSAVDMTEDFVPLGRKFVVVNDASGFRPGDPISLYRPGTRQWITDIRMDQITPSEGTVQWAPSSYSFHFERLLLRVSGDTLFFRNPVVMAFEARYGGGKVFRATFPRLEKVGVEDLCLKSSYASETDENHSWKAISYKSVEHGWVRRVSSWYFAYSCVSLERSSRLISVIDCHCREPKSQITGGRRYSFNLVGSLNLFRDCSTTEGRHDFVSSSRVCGPNVFTRCRASKAHSDIGPHHRWAMGTLFDLVDSDGQINVQDRDDMGTGHGWAGANQVFWNCSGASSVCQSPWASALNYNFGFLGRKSSGARAGRPDGVWVGHQLPGLVPASLFEAQLEARKMDRRYFAVYPELKASGARSFQLALNMPLDSSTLKMDSIHIGGTAGLDEAEFHMAILNDTLLSFTFPYMLELPAHATLRITLAHLQSAGGTALSGGNTALYHQPDLRPVVTGEARTVNNEDDVLRVSSSKAGWIYLVKYPGSYRDVDDLEAALEENKGRKAEAEEAGLQVGLATRGLPDGFFIYYAVDMDGRMSEPDSKLARIEATGAVTGQGSPEEVQAFQACYAGGLIHLRPLDEGGTYQARIYDLRGRLLASYPELRGVQALSPPEGRGLVLLQITSSGDRESLKVILP